MKNVALVTGASSGIGKALAKVHAAKGGDLIITARREDKLQTLKTELEEKYKVKVKIYISDLSAHGAATELYQKIMQSGLQVEYLINNAGFGGQGKFYQRDWATDLSMINLNIVALTELCRLFLPDMVANDSGKILNVSSTASLVPGPLQAVYFATKAYVTSFSNAIADELHDTKVTITALLPGATETEFAEVSGMENTRLFAHVAGVTEVAQAGYDAMIAGDRNVVAGLPEERKAMMEKFLPVPEMVTQVRRAQEIISKTNS